MSQGNSSFSSYSWATGRISFSANWWTQSRISLCSSVSSNESIGISRLILYAYVQVLLLRLYDGADESGTVKAIEQLGQPVHRFQVRHRYREHRSQLDDSA